MIRPLLFTIAVLLILFGFSGLYMLPKLINQKIEQKLQIKIGTKLFDRFQNIPVSLKIRFYFLNITNKDQVLSGSQRPVFEEVGPFTFEERRRRYVTDFEDNGRKLRYRESKFYYPLYDEEKQQLLSEQLASHNNSKAQDIITSSNVNRPNQLERMLNPNANNITIINVPLLSVLTKLANLPEGTLKRTLAAKIAQKLVEDGNDKILITKPANELLFDGYKVDFLEAAKSLFESLGFNFDSLSPLPGNKFGFYFMKNGTWNKKEGGEFLIWTGRHGSMADFPQIVSWNDQSTLQVWPNDTRAGDRCNRVHGTDGSSFHPGLSRHQTLYVFSPLICTSIYFKYQEDTQVNGIPVWRYTTPPDVFSAPGKNERKQCYCTIKRPNGRSSLSSLNYASSPISGSTQSTLLHDDFDSMSSNQNGGSLSSSSQSVQGGPIAAINNSRCFIDGILDLSLCQRGAPIAASGAHFYNADPMLALSTGLKPDKHKHETFIDIEPMTGNVMRASSRAQLNAFVEDAAMQVIDSNVTGKMTPMIAPLMWLEEQGGIDDKLAAEFKSKLLNMVFKVRRTCLICIVTGLILIALITIHYWYTTCYRVDLKAIRERSEKRRRQQRAARAAAKRYNGNLTSYLRESKKLNQDSDVDDQNEHDDETERAYKQRKSCDSNLLNPINHAGSDVVAGSLGAIAAKNPISTSDTRRLIDDDTEDADLDDNSDSEELRSFRQIEKDLAEATTSDSGRKPETFVAEQTKSKS